MGGTEDGHELAFILAVITANTKPTMLRQGPCYCIDLVAKGLLNTKDVRLKFLDQSANALSPKLPRKLPI
jgi:hypothetical protein